MAVQVEDKHASSLFPFGMTMTILLNNNESHRIHFLRSRRQISGTGNTQDKAVFWMYFGF